MAKAKTRRGKGRQSTKIRAVPKPANDTNDNFPTPERESHNAFRRVGMGKRIIPVIDQLGPKPIGNGALTEEEHRALSYYRDQASLADKSPVRSCCDFSPRGGHGPGVAIMSAAIETGKIERNMGALWTLCRAVCVDDVTLEEWVRQHYGTIWLDKAHPQDARAWMAEKVGITTLELKYAAGGIVR